MNTHGNGAAAVARPAAAIVLVRDGAHRVTEVFMVQRAAHSSFAPNALSFPGGTVESTDAAELPGNHDGMLDALGTAMHLEASPEGRGIATAHIVAALRELLEESAILLAVHNDGAVLSEADRGLIDVVGDEIDSGVSFRDALQRHDLIPCLGELVYGARFVTPLDRSKRFDARFFLGRPPAQEPRFRLAELQGGGWVDPRSVLDDDGVSLMPPTRVLCTELASHSTASETFEALRHSPLEHVPEGVI